jgi:HEAT repeat protein
MRKQVARTLLPVIPTAVCVFLWVDSTFAVRRLPFIPIGDAALGFKSAAGWLSWDEFTLWDPVNPEAPWISIPYWALVSVGLAFAWRAVVRQRKDPRFRWWEWATLGAVALLLVSLQGRTDPVNHLLRAIRNPHDHYVLHEAYEAVDEVNRADRGGDAAVLLNRLLDDNNSSVRTTAALALGRLHADPKLVVSSLTRAHADKNLRHVVTITLGEIGPVDGRVVPALILSLRDEDPKVRGAAASALLKLLFDTTK